MYYGILFSGQGAQQSGMGVELMADSLFSRIVSQASAVCELDLLKIMKNEVPLKAAITQKTQNDV